MDSFCVFEREGAVGEEKGRGKVRAIPKRFCVLCDLKFSVIKSAGLALYGPSTELNAFLAPKLEGQEGERQGGIPWDYFIGKRITCSPDWSARTRLGIL